MIPKSGKRKRIGAAFREIQFFFRVMVIPGDVDILEAIPEI